MEKGEIVFVRWYGDVLQGEVVENDRKDLLAGMVAVRIPIQGVRITALFHPDHVYNKWEEAANVSYPVSFPKPADIIHINPQHVYQSEDEAKGNSPIISPNPPKVATEASEISREIQESQEIICEKIQDSSKIICSNTEPDAIITQLETEKQDIVSSDGWKMIQQFKAEHWDHAHNHLRIDALDEFYQLWKSVTSPVLMVLNTDPENIDKAKEEFANYGGVIYVKDAKPTHYIVSDQRMEQLKSQLKQSLKPQQKIVQLDLFS